MIKVVRQDRVELVVDNATVGYMETVLHEDYAYCVYIEIFRDYRHCGYATRLVDEYRATLDKPLVYSLVSENSIGAKFWNEYTKDKKVRKIKGLTFEIGIDK